jgi:hypothetical protein
VGITAETSKWLLEIFVWSENYGAPAYKHLRGLGNASPLVEGVIGALFQLSKDGNNPNLPPVMKARNALIVGVEYALTDAISAPAAAFGATFGAGLFSETGPGAIIGGIAGYVAGNVAGNVIVTEAMDYMYWDPINESLGISP